MRAGAPPIRAEDRRRGVGTQAKEDLDAALDPPDHALDTDDNYQVKAGIMYSQTPGLESRATASLAARQ